VIDSIPFYLEIVLFFRRLATDPSCPYPEWMMECICPQGYWHGACTCGHKYVLPNGASWWENIRNHAEQWGEVLPEGFYHDPFDRYKARYDFEGLRDLLDTREFHPDCPEELRNMILSVWEDQDRCRSSFSDYDDSNCNCGRSGPTGGHHASCSFYNLGVEDECWD